jgi:hypothetical protein
VAFCLACKCGQELGPRLVAEGCICFVGYNSDVIIQPAYSQVFSECATSGFSSFLTGETVGSSVIRMKEKYTSEIDYIYPRNSVVASVLMANRDAIVSFGDTSVKISEFSA